MTESQNSLEKEPKELDEEVKVPAAQKQPVEEPIEEIVGEDHQNAKDTEDLDAMFHLLKLQYKKKDKNLVLIENN